ncbi:MAG: hypothetical protein A3G41_05495 [Elusimicrobia bacterium RIFCSPLOWO2_12_FULL_59_9]|nr:MAG: hypothetical protein A3G41_05495 [Elusimicrobia bacterium RIFCSPLOWO2_12_FULL_59_9]
MSQTQGAQPRSVSVQGAVCQFALRGAIDDALDDLIIAGADKVTLLKDNRSRTGRLSLSRSQIKNVVNVAGGTRSPEAVSNFIRYQMGRQGGLPWRHPTVNRQVFGREVIADIECEKGGTSTIETATRTVCEKVKAQLQDRNYTTDVTELEREARAQLTALYLGYLNRTYAYCEAMDKDNKNCWDDVARIAKRKGGAA